MTLMPAGTLSIGSSLPPVGDIGTARAVLAAGAGGGASALAGAGGGAGALAGGGGRVAFCFGATTSIFGSAWAVSIGEVACGGAPGAVSLGAPACPHARSARARL